MRCRKTNNSPGILNLSLISLKPSFPGRYSPRQDQTRDKQGPWSNGKTFAFNEVQSSEPIPERGSSTRAGVYGAGWIMP